MTLAHLTIFFVCYVCLNLGGASRKRVSGVRLPWHVSFSQPKNKRFWSADGSLSSTEKTTRAPKLSVGDVPVVLLQIFFVIYIRAPSLPGCSPHLRFGCTSKRFSGRDSARLLRLRLNPRNKAGATNPAVVACVPFWRFHN